jgi:hypothetical protein
MTGKARNRRDQTLDGNHNRLMGILLTALGALCMFSPLASLFVQAVAAKPLALSGWPMTFAALGVLLLVIGVISWGRGLRLLRRATKPARPASGPR